MSAEQHGRKAKWRALAAEARACAAETSEPRARRILQEIAAAYERLAIGEPPQKMPS